MAELVDATDLKSVGLFALAGSSPAEGTIFKIYMHKAKITQETQDISDIKSLVESDLALVDKLLAEILHNKSVLIQKVAKNIFNAGGKRIRPLLTILSAKLFNFQQKEIYYLAAAVELIHTATLLHDDVIDESDLRRGKETANVQYGNKTSILVGDFLFAESFKYMVNSKSLIALQNLARASSIITQGEIQQLELIKNQNFALKPYFEVIRAKTAELFGAAAKAAALVANRSQSEANILYEFAVNLGLAFQIIDDILDYSSEAINLGKNQGDDFFEQKVTLPIILLHKSSNIAERLELENIFNSKIVTRENLNYILTELTHKNILEDSFNYAKSHIDKSLNLLSNFPNSEAKEILAKICYISLNRKF